MIKQSVNLPIAAIEYANYIYHHQAMEYANYIYHQQAMDQLLEPGRFDLLLPLFP